MGQAVAVVREDRPGDRRLTAYLAPASPLGSSPDSPDFPDSQGTGGGADWPPDPQEVRRAVAAVLPDYMVPSAVVVLDRIPLTVNGKVHRAALPAPDAELLPGGRGPRTPFEEILCRLYAETLGVAQVSIDDGFFGLGGHSLLAIQLIARIQKVLGRDYGVRVLFEAPTVAELAVALQGPHRPDDALAPVLPLRRAGTAPALFCLHPAGGLSWCYSGLISHLPPGRPLYGLQAHGLAGPARLPATMADLAASYAGQILAVQGRGPYHLLGWSFGGTAAEAQDAHAPVPADLPRTLELLRERGSALARPPTGAA